jgi:hypothetical protein
MRTITTIIDAAFWLAVSFISIVGGIAAGVAVGTSAFGADNGGFGLVALGLGVIGCVAASAALHRLATRCQRTR